MADNQIPVLDAQGAPVLDEQGNPTVAPPAVTAEQLTAMQAERDAARTDAETARQELEIRRQAELQSVIAKGNQATAEARVKEDQDIREMMLTDPEKATQMIVEREGRKVTAAIPNIVSAQIKAEQARRETLSAYPQLLPQNNAKEQTPLFKKVLEYMTLRPHLFRDPEGMKTAAIVMAQELGIKPAQVEQTEAIRQTQVNQNGTEGADVRGTTGVIKEFSDAEKDFLSRFKIKNLESAKNRLNKIRGAK